MVRLSVATSDTPPTAATQCYLLAVVEGRQAAHNNKWSKRQVAIAFNTSSLTSARKVVIRGRLVTSANSNGLGPPISAVGAVTLTTAGNTTAFAVKNYDCRAVSSAV